jgi:hypothetical protein
MIIYDHDDNIQQPASIMWDRMHPHRMHPVDQAINFKNACVRESTHYVLPSSVVFCVDFRRRSRDIKQKA